MVQDLSAAPPLSGQVGVRQRLVFEESGCHALTPRGQIITQNLVQADSACAAAIHALNVLQVS